MMLFGWHWIEGFHTAKMWAFFDMEPARLGFHPEKNTIKQPKDKYNVYDIHDYK